MSRHTAEPNVKSWPQDLRVARCASSPPGAIRLAKSVPGNRGVGAPARALPQLPPAGYTAPPGGIAPENEHSVRSFSAFPIETTEQIFGALDELPVLAMVTVRSRRRPESDVAGSLAGRLLGKALVSS